MLPPLFFGSDSDVTEVYKLHYALHDDAAPEINAHLAEERELLTISSSSSTQGRELTIKKRGVRAPDHLLLPLLFNTGKTAYDQEERASLYPHASEPNALQNKWVVVNDVKDDEPEPLAIFMGQQPSASEDGSLDSFQVFDTHAAGSEDLVAFVQGLDSGRLVLMGVRDEASSTISNAAAQGSDGSRISAVRLDHDDVIDNGGSLPFVARLLHKLVFNHWTSLQEFFRQQQVIDTNKDGVLSQEACCKVHEFENFLTRPAEEGLTASPEPAAIAKDENDSENVPSMQALLAQSDNDYLEEHELSLSPQPAAVAEDDKDKEDVPSMQAMLAQIDNDNLEEHQLTASPELAAVAKARLTELVGETPG
ncbi:hypothetical protein AK812_SmicGene20917 [Symbiodinium microadriaticum]|uniref:ILEI/PANDER domain-containing protein n=1 Tax=Symbiodinium microadriaticum TaxID=2951 RepID=A0A1Q9DNP7_SYMMI|nr:hypothetical protein AK812_SmicGene20917 [Symbiodinium microadriaticum]